MNDKIEKLVTEQLNNEEGVENTDEFDYPMFDPTIIQQPMYSPF